MRKTMAVALAALVAVSLLAAPGHAGKKNKKNKKKKIEERVSVTAAPFPNLSSATGTPTPGCSAGEEGVHKQTIPLHVPGKGKLTADMEGFTGDWDLYVFDAQDRVLARSEAEQVPGGAPAEEAVALAFKKMTDVKIVVCNWAGAPQAEVHYKLVYTPAKGHHH